MNNVHALVSEPTRSVLKGPAPGVALSLSGGGFRAMLFHTGALWRLGELGFFLDKPLVGIDSRTGEATDVGKMKRISSVSGGSIVAAVLALALARLEMLEGEAFAASFIEAVVAPVRRLAGLNLAGTSVKGIFAVLEDVAAPGSVNDHVAAAYDAHLYHGKTLQDLPDRIQFMINATNLQSGALWRFSKRYMRDWRIGEVKNPTLSLARAVGASAAFPPVLAPAALDLADSQFTPNSGEGRDAAGSLQRAPFTTSPQLADGGVYDNLALETCFKSFKTLFVSNAGKPFEPRGDISKNWASIGARCLDVMDNQVLSQRKILLMNALESKERTGAFWDIQQDVQKHACANCLPCPPERTAALARVSTDLAAKSSSLQKQLINWGYASADAAVRGSFNSTYPQPQGFPYPRSGV